MYQHTLFNDKETWGRNKEKTKYHTKPWACPIGDTGPVGAKPLQSKPNYKKKKDSKQDSEDNDNTVVDTNRPIRGVTAKQLHLNRPKSKSMIKAAANNDDSEYESEESDDEDNQSDPSAHSGGVTSRHLHLKRPATKSKSKTKVLSQKRKKKSKARESDDSEHESATDDEDNQLHPSAPSGVVTSMHLHRNRPVAKSQSKTKVLTQKRMKKNKTSKESPPPELTESEFSESEDESDTDDDFHLNRPKPRQDSDERETDEIIDDDNNSRSKPMVQPLPYNPPEGFGFLLEVREERRGRQKERVEDPVVMEWPPSKKDSEFFRKWVATQVITRSKKYQAGAMRVDPKSLARMKEGHDPNIEDDKSWVPATKRLYEYGWRVLMRILTEKHGR